MEVLWRIGQNIFSDRHKAIREYKKLSKKDSSIKIMFVVVTDYGYTEHDITEEVKHGNKK